MKKGCFLGIAIVLLITLSLAAMNPALYADNYSVSENVKVTVRDNSVVVRNKNNFRLHSLSIAVFDKDNLKTSIRRYENLVVEARDTIDIQLGNNRSEFLYVKMEYQFGFSVGKTKNLNRLQGDIMALSK